MGWRSLHHEMVEVDLVEDGPAGLEPRSAAPDRGPPPVRTSAATRLSRRVGILACATVLVVTALVVDQVRHAGGPVVGLVGAASSLELPLEETWRLGVESDWSVAAGVLLTTDRRTGGLDVHAYDLRTGQERWALAFSDQDTAAVHCPVEVRADDGPSVVCQVVALERPPGRSYGAVRQPGRLLMVSALDGTVTRELALVPEHVGFAAVDGDLVLATGSDETVLVERISVDTGTPRWSVQVPWDGSSRAATRVIADDGLVVVAGRTTTIVDAQDGRQLGQWAGESLGRARPGRPWAVIMPHGFAVRTDATARYSPTTWYSPDGAALGQLEGTVFEPEVSDGSVPEVVLVATTGWGNLRAIDVEAGVALWSVDMDGGLPEVRADGTVVLAGPGVLRSVDLRTGDERWRTAGDGLAQVQAVSDGRVVLAIGTILGVGSAVSAISIRDGSLLWRAPMPAGGQSLRVLDGQVVAVGPGVVIGLGRSEASG